MSKQKAKKSRKAVPSYWWFEPETTVALRDQLNASLEGGARLEVRIDGKKNMTLTVVPLGANLVVALTTLNKSHYCPPQCP